MASPDHEALRERVATEEGVGDWSDTVVGRTEDELRASAIALRVKIGRGVRHPTLESALAERRRQRDAMAQRLWGSS